MDKLQSLDKKKLSVISFSLLVLVLAAGLVYVYTQVEVTEQSETLNTNATVLDSDNANGTLEAGIATGQRMSFGEFDARFNKTKTLNLSATDPTMVEINVEGNISDHLRYDRLHLFENKTQIDLEMIGNQPGFYDGEISLEMVIAQNEWGEKWINIVYSYFL